MKRIIIAIIILCVGVISAQAQVKFGVRAGLNASSWQGEAVQSLQNAAGLSNGIASTKMRPSFHAGVYANIPFGEYFALEPGLFYSQKGYIMNGTFASNSFEFLNAKATVTDQAHYIDLPVLAKVYLSKGFHVYAGPQLSYLVDNQIKTEAGVFGFSVLNRSFKANNGFQKLDVGIAGGLGYRFENGLNLQAGYDYGLRTIDERGNFDSYNRVIKVSLGYEF